MLGPDTSLSGKMEWSRNCTRLVKETWNVKAYGESGMYLRLSVFTHQCSPIRVRNLVRARCVQTLAGELDEISRDLPLV